MKTRILVTGASGNIGREVLKTLVQHKNDFDITVFDKFSKTSHKVLSPYQKDISIIYGDISNPADTVVATQNQDIVIHLAALIPPTAYDHPELAYKINVEGTKNLIHNLETNAPEAFLIYTSSVAVYGDRLKNHHIRVTDPINPVEGDTYGQSKVEAEHLVKNSQLKWSIFRLSAIMGAGNHKISGIMFLMPLETPLEITTPEDAANALFKATKHLDTLQGRIFNLGGGTKNRIIYRDFLKQNFKIYGLGALNFPEGAFASKDYHCGYYADGDELEAILRFRNDNLSSYFEKVKKSVSWFTYSLASIFNPIIKRVLLLKSEPYNKMLNRAPTL